MSLAEFDSAGNFMHLLVLLLAHNSARDLKHAMILKVASISAHLVPDQVLVNFARKQLAQKIYVHSFNYCFNLLL